MSTSDSESTIRDATTGHEAADESGYVKMPNVSMLLEMAPPSSSTSRGSCWPGFSGVHPAK